MHGLKRLSNDKKLYYNLSNIDINEQKKDFQVISHLLFLYITTPHILNTDYNIKCSLLERNTIELFFTLSGIDEMLYIVEFVKSTGDHYHLYGGFNLYTGDDKTSFNILNAITIYKYV